MSPDDIDPDRVAVEGLGEQFTPEEQAAFDAMRAGGEVEAPPDQPHEPEPEPAPQAAKPAATPQAPPQAPAEPDSDPDVEVTDPKTGTKQKRVSIHKYQRLEQRAKEAEEAREKVAKERQELLDRFARADERLKIITEAMQTPAEPERKEEEDPAPDPAQDIFAYAQWQGRQIEKLNNRLSGIESGVQQSSTDTELANTYRSDAAQFAAKEPAFAEAYVYLINQRDQELQLAGVTDERARRAQIVREEKGLVTAAINQRRSPAEMLFNIAKGRGYRPQAAAPAPAPTNGVAPPSPATPPKDPNALDAPQAQAQANGHAAPAAPAAPQPPAAPSVTAEIEAIKRGQEASASLSNVGGGAPVRELTSQVLADMPEEEFNDLVARLPREKLMELMGN